MENMPVGVFASIDAGLGVKLEVVRDLGIKTIQLHTPAKESRTPENAKAFLEKLNRYGITTTVVFLGFEGESYETIAKAAETVGFVPASTREARRSRSLRSLSRANALPTSSSATARFARSFIMKRSRRLSARLAKTARLS